MVLLFCRQGLLDDMEKNDRMIGDVYDKGDELLQKASGDMKVPLF